ncbi:MAG: zf-HC2 domain-containing protein [candidate division Zixibacteria bacterium]|nr:zf-HC2 domain-containing protein [candidate division Zixibacteria bacterium]
MHHGYFKDRISAYHDGDLRPEEMELIVRHLEGCDECRKLLAEFEKFDSLVEKHSGLAGDEYFEKSAQKIERLIAGEHKPEIIDIKRPSWFGLGWKVAAAVASFAVIGFIGLHQSDIMEQVQKTAVAPAEKVPAAWNADTARTESVVIRPVGEAEEFPPGAEPGASSADKSIGRPSSVPTREIAKAAKTEPAKMTADEEAASDVGILQPVDVAPETTKAAEEEKEERHKLKSAESAEPTARGDKKDKLPPVTPPDSPSTAVVRGESIAQVQRLMVESDNFGAGRSDSASTPSRTLEEWRRTKDSCQGELDQLAAVGKGARGIRLTEGAKDIKQQLEKALLDANYNIGLLTDDRSEFEKAVDYIRNYTTNEGAPHRELAQQYLKTLTSLKTE